MLSMFYEPKNGHGLPHNPFNALIVPRPIGWISSVNKEGIANLAPFSFFNAVSYTPPQVMFAATGSHEEGGLKDSVQNIHDTGEFVVNLATYPLKDAVNLSSIAAPNDQDEFSIAGLEKDDSKLISVPRVRESPVHLECRYIQTVELPSASPTSPNLVIFGEVIGVHIQDDMIKDGLVDMTALQPLSRLGYKDYAGLGNTFSMDRPKWNKEL